MKADRLMGVPISQKAGVHSAQGELCLLTSEPPMNSYGETLMKEVLDFLFEGALYQDNVRPTWLNGLELDCYYPDLKIGFEYQGFQYSYFVPDYHRSLADLKRQQEHDKRKKKLCREQKVILVVIEYWALSIGQVGQRIIKQVSKHKKWEQVTKIWEIVGRTTSRESGRLKERKAINKKCATYEECIKANYKSGKWVKRQAY